MLMDRRTERSIKKALDVIRKGEHDKARPLLLAILKDDPAQAEAWFLLSYVVPERGRRIYALRQALNANPDFSRAQERLSKLSGQPPSAAERPQQPGDRPPAPAFVPPADNADDAGDELRDNQGFTEQDKSWAAGEDFNEGDEGGGSGFARTLLGVLVVVALLAAVYFLAGDAIRGIFSGGAGAHSTATESSAFRTLPPTWTPAGAITATPEPQTTGTPAQQGEEPQGFNFDFPAPNSAAQALMDEIRAEVLAVRGLTTEAEADDYIITRDQAVDVLEQLYLTAGVSETITREQDVLVALGLAPADYFLADYELSSQADQLGGFYVPALDSIFVIGEDFSGIGPFIYAHEYEHALADENFDLSGLGPEECNVLSDLCRATIALVEGDATLLSRQWLNTFANPEVVEEVVLAFFDQLDAMLVAGQPPPPFISQDLAFPYSQGELFADALVSASGWDAIDAAYVTPPNSTEQILHPDKYVAGEQPLALESVDISSALPAGWERLLDGRLGEWMTYLLLWLGPSEAETVADPVAAASAAAGWGNDVIQSYQRADGSVLLSAHWVWDSAGDASEMLAAMQGQLGNRFGAPITPIGGGQCWAGGGLISCLYGDGDQTLWLQGPDAETITAIRALYAQFN